jgi:hypothetical protein
MALSADALTTAAIVAAEVSGISLPADQAAVERQINVASDAIRRFCNRPLTHAVVTSERYKALDGHRLILKRRPVLSIESIVTASGSVVSSGYYIENAEAGIIWFDSSLAVVEETAPGSMAQDGLPGSGEADVLVSYTGGWITEAQVAAAAAETPPRTITRTLPYELEDAAIKTFSSLWHRRGVDLAAGAFDGSNEAIGRGLGGIIPGPIIPSLKRFQTWVL